MQEVIYYLVGCLVGGLLFGVVTVRRGSLTVGAAVTAGLLATVVILMAGPVWLLPLLVFFLSSVVIERVLPSRSEASDAKDKRARDAVQVLCNGGVYGLLCLIDAPEVLLLITMSVATADTWASAVGKYFGQPTYDIVRGQRVPVGLSGGVSVAGTVGAGAGAVLIGITGGWIATSYSVGLFLAVVGYGCWGMLLDSVLGAGLQARYQDEELRLTDQEGDANRLVGGYRWLTNDLVNLLAIGITVGIAGWAL